MRGEQVGESRRDEVEIVLLSSACNEGYDMPQLEKAVWKDCFKAVVSSRGVVVVVVARAASHEMSQLTHLWLWCVLRTVVGGDSL